MSSAVSSGHLEEVFEIGAAMKRSGLPDEFVANAVKTAQRRRRARYSAARDSAPTDRGPRHAPKK